MSDYTQTTDFSAKDNLASGNANKLIKGADFDTEFGNIVTAITSKYDSSDLASQAQAEAGTSSSVLMTPQGVQYYADANAGMVGDIQALADPNADRLLFWDDSAGAAALLTVGSTLKLSGTTLSVADALAVATSLSIGGGSTITDSTKIALTNTGNTFTTNQSLKDSAETGDIILTLENAAGTRRLELLYIGTSASSAYGIGAGEVGINANGGVLYLSTSDAAALKIDSSQNFDFYDGTVTTSNSSASEVGYKGVPQNSQSVDYTCVLGDAGKQIYQTGASKTITIPANGSVAYPVGTVLTFAAAGNSVTIAITTDTMYLAGTTTTGSRTLAAHGVATAVKITSTTWLISGAGLS